MTTVVAIRRSDRWAPGVHAQNDAAILQETAAWLGALGWAVVNASEEAIEAGGPVPRGEVYLNMAQGPEASRRLVALDDGSARFYNRPRAVLACHRRAMIERLSGAMGSFVPSFVVDEADDPRAALAWLTGLPDGGSSAWVKRGDVHAEGPLDVQRVARDDLADAIGRMRARGIRTVVVQPHIEGPSIKVYGVAGGWLRFCGGNPSSIGAGVEADLRRDVFAAASRLGLDVFGGDAIVAAPDRAVLIDVNDWPSFAPVRGEASRAIAEHVRRSAGRDLRRDAVEERSP